jgi:hypothetical protein
MPPDVADGWMMESGHKWVDTWWDLEEFGRLAEGFRALVAPPGLARTVYDAILRSKATRLKGWLNVTDVVAEVVRHTKTKGLSPFDVFAAGAGSMGLPRDMAYAQVIIPGRKSGTFSTSVFVRVSVSFVNDHVEPAAAAGGSDLAPGRPDAWQADTAQGGVWEPPAAPSGDGTAWGGQADSWDASGYGGSAGSAGTW